MSRPIPDPVQQTVRDLAERMTYFAEAADNGGSWMTLQTWLVSMRPQFDMLLDIGFKDIPNAARMTITQEAQDRIAQSFVVPDSLEGQGE